MRQIWSRHGHELKTRLLEGSEMSAAALAYALHDLMCHPSCYAKVLFPDLNAHRKYKSRRARCRQECRRCLLARVIFLMQTTSIK